MGLANYVYKGNVLTKKECNLLIKEGSKDLEQGTMFKGGNKSFKDLGRRNSNVSFYRNGSSALSIIKKVFTEIRFISLELYGTYITHLEPVQYSEYEKGMFYSWHTDLSNDISRPLERDMSASLVLSNKNEYTGGSLQMVTPDCISKDNIFVPQDVEDQEQGTLILFPSSMIHQVTPVLSGVRKSLVLWTCSKIKPA